MTLSNFPLMFLQGSISCLIACSAAWGLLRLAQRRWPSLATRRTPWLLAHVAGAATLVLVMLPAASRFSLLSVAPKHEVAGAARPVPDNGIAAFQQDGGNELYYATGLPALAWLWLACYVGGVTRYTLRWLRVRRSLQALLYAADRLEDPALRTHAGFSGHGGVVPPVFEIDAPVSPMLAGLIRPVLLVPCHMRGFPPTQQQLIIAHELMHLRRCDHLWQHASTLLQVLLWFVPFAHSFHDRLQLALELGCDRAVLAGSSHDERRSYAAALLAQLAVQVSAVPCTTAASVAFGIHGAHAVADRIRLIRDAHSVSSVPLASTAVLLLLPALCGATVLFQPHFAWRDATSAAPETPADISNSKAAPSPLPVWQAPLARLHVSAGFGSINRPGGKAHNGMDFGTPRGTVVIAPGDGRVAVSADRYDGGAPYGKVVVIDHASGLRTLYAHLDGRLVQAGEFVRAGQQIALSGATGKVTGPHLHFEVLRGGVDIDPRSLLGAALAQSPP